MIIDTLNLVLEYNVSRIGLPLPGTTRTRSTYRYGVLTAVVVVQLYAVLQSTIVYTAVFVCRFGTSGISYYCLFVLTHVYNNK
jgi:hypothetical protein